MRVVWAKAGRGIWGLGHLFEGPFTTKDIFDDKFVPRNRKRKAIPKPEAKPAPKPTAKGKHVQLFKVRRRAFLKGPDFFFVKDHVPEHFFSFPLRTALMRRKVGKGFYSTAPDAPDGQ